MAAYNFTIKGQFGEVDHKLVEVVDDVGNVVGFHLPDGRMVQLVMALEVVNLEGDKFEYITEEKEMENLGLSLLNYDNMTFTEED